MTQADKLERLQRELMELENCLPPELIVGGCYRYHLHRAAALVQRMTASEVRTYDATWFTLMRERDDVLQGDR
jgi:hypothetical protein